jgi:hypothetical protein
MKNIFFLTFAILFISGCGLFETRTPEYPDTDGGTFIPPTSPDIVIDNFVECIKNKNIDNYISCFVETGYSFIPSSNASATFPSFFDN